MTCNFSKLTDDSNCFVLIFQVWFQNRRAKYRKRENTKKGPGRPAHNAQPQTCSGEPISQEELERKDRDRRERKMHKQLEKQQKKLAAKGIHVDVETLRKDYEMQRAQGGKTNFSSHYEVADSGTNDMEIDVVGEDGSDDDDDDEHEDEMRRRRFLAQVANSADANRKKMSAFSIESLLSSSQSHFFRQQIVNQGFSDDEDADDLEEEEHRRKRTLSTKTIDDDLGIKRETMSPQSSPPRSSSTPVPTTTTAVVRPSSPSPNMSQVDFASHFRQSTTDLLQLSTNTNSSTDSILPPSTMTSPSHASGQMLRPFAASIVRPIASKATPNSPPPCLPNLPTLPLPPLMTQQMSFPSFLTQKMFCNNSQTSPT